VAAGATSAEFCIGVPGPARADPDCPGRCRGSAWWVATTWSSRGSVRSAARKSHTFARGSFRPAVVRLRSVTGPAGARPPGGRPCGRGP